MSSRDQVFGVGATWTTHRGPAADAAGSARSASGRKKRGPKAKPPTERAVRSAKPVQRVERSYSSQKRDQVLVFMEQQRVHDPGSRSAGADGYRRPYSREAAEYFKIPMSTIHTWWQMRRKKMAQEAGGGCDGLEPARAATPLTPMSGAAPAASTAPPASDEAPASTFLPPAPTSWAPVPHPYSPSPTSYSPAYNSAPNTYPPAPDAYGPAADPYGPPPSAAPTAPSAYSPAPAYAAYTAQPSNAGHATPAWCYDHDARPQAMPQDYASAFHPSPDTTTPPFAAPEYSAYAALPAKPDAAHGVKRQDSPMFHFQNNADGHVAAGGVDVKPSIIGTSA
ncbi:hypothetical protein CDD82_1128 [Ophiocordyceps australis]|uniref:Uncharacterized protein n=1 Tax=Ophiocordyceps australis TaxID=1399860 RepID=A0A2C5YJB2_9HYPO|nr:hypothetical protein CDD82_1128 [Ophiocordyceps australis]